MADKPNPDVIRLKMQQMVDHVGDVGDRVRALELANDALREHLAPQARVSARLDGFEAELAALREVIEVLAVYTHRHTDPLLHERSKDVPFWPPGCPEQCWRKCECAKLCGDDFGITGKER